jgi:hypothetical protein
VGSAVGPSKLLLRKAPEGEKFGESDAVSIEIETLSQQQYGVVAQAPRPRGWAVEGAVRAAPLDIIVSIGSRFYLAFLRP